MPIETTARSASAPIGTTGAEAVQGPVAALFHGLRGTTIPARGWIWLAVALPILTAGCKEENPAFDDPTAAGTSDATTGSGPTGDGIDDGVDDAPGDTGPGDTGPGDTGPGDTGPGDTGPGDTGPGDTGPADTGEACVEPMQLCGGVCVDTSIEHNHCGMCFQSCHPVMEMCVDGMCVGN
jgi:hypothetical protein